MKLLLGLLLLLPLLAWGETRTADQFFDQKMGDFKAELAAARQEGKKGILLMYELDDCPFCHRMKGTILNQAEVQDLYRKHFLIFTIDTKGDTAMVDFKGKATTEKAFSFDNRVRATPVFAFYDLAGNQMARYTGATKDAQEFLLLGRYVVEDAYKAMPFVQYKQQAK